MRLSATKALLERRDVVIVATVSAIYGLGDPAAYHKMVLHLARGTRINQRDLLRRLAEIQYSRNPLDLSRGTYRVRGDVIDIFPADSERDAVRVELFDDEIEQISTFDPLTGEVEQTTPRVTIYPKTHYVTPRETLLAAVDQIRIDLGKQLTLLRAANKLVEAQRLEQRTRFDLEMIVEVGVLLGYRELLSLPVGPPARRAAAVPVRLSARRRFVVRRREPRDDSADRRHVQGRSLAQRDARRVRVPFAVGARQPAVVVRRVRADRTAVDLRLRDAGPLRAHATTKSSSKSSGPRVSWTPTSRYDRPERRSTTCCRRSTNAPSSANGSSSRR